ncbi:CarD family transcriptional regulator [Desulfitobacterium hafniense]|uniref:CarD family transcriptional regulator n=1 Tax=Desulfitobacterium hafniense TaxID=49338 RepID=A0A0W1JF19_DESHA|nr:CarD family transcriptional regulator [Desulfitobacterium hafniense]KTE90401.1 CarD family transcriptional regulator [Desulfitobacterium hafniense]
MFQVGDKILYPLYGAGIIEDIKEKEVLGKKRLYYFMNIPHIRLKIMIPIEKTNDLGIRKVVNPDVLQHALNDLYSGTTDPLSDDNQRYRRDMNKSKIKTGDIYKGIEIIRDLTRKSKVKKLGAEDKAMLENALQILTSEFIQVRGVCKEQAVHLLNEVINV